MKTLLAFLFAFCFAMGAAFSQAHLDVVHLKNGNVFRGNITRNQPNEPLELKTGPGNVFVFQRDEIASITTELFEINADSLLAYGGPVSIGAAIGGGGLLGLPLRINLGKTSAFEAGLFFRPFIVKFSDSYDVKGGLLVAGALNLGMKKQYKPLKRKVVSNGVFIRGGTGISKYKETVLGFGWVSERFRQNNKKYSFISELGPGLVIRHWLTDPDLGFIPDKTSEVGFILAWKIHWNSYPN
ncbi:MAG: hypothetical protein K9J37_22890 [Saprospiraceae bacterium]|nr:hypothetical protein [Saprospiraceae bacterium]MCF8252773.1 hypothetical protein [Saprospiraceae bacterium]MCF8283164.1 hypothetical protein [Bacteroidales bacterium]MCF8314328.1 hypothetical protein [Saprospiraceae bacterium]MCF8443200.1 hypothetical protein [Saprospiraceae bacterium]